MKDIMLGYMSFVVIIASVFCILIALQYRVTP